MIASIIGIVAYVLGALGFYTIANRRGINHAWLAWVPIGNLWLLGCISDQYQSVVRGKTSNKRKIMLVLGIVQALCAVVIFVLCITMIVQLITMGGFAVDQEFSFGIYGDEMYPGDIYVDDYYGDVYDQELPAEMMGTILSVAVVSVLLSLSTLPVVILQYIALYDVFRSCDPSNSTLFLLLSIFLGISSFLVFACRDKDLGMWRPKPPVPPVYQPVYTQPTVYSDEAQTPVQQPAEPPAEPCERADSD